MDKYPDTDFDLKTISGGDFEIIELKEGWFKHRHILNVQHRHTFHEIIWITSGVDFHSVDFEDYNVCARNILCIPKGSVHDFKPANDTRGWKLIFDDNFFMANQLMLFRESQLFIPFWGNKLIDLSDAEFSITANTFTLINTLTSKKQLQIVLINFISFLNDCFESKITQTDTLFFDFLQLLNKEIYLNREVSYFASTLGVSPRLLNEVVKRVTGRTTLDYIHARLINEAKSKLLYSHYSIKEIAYSLGFEDALYFSRFFKKRTLCSPEEFRKTESQISIK